MSDMLVHTLLAYCWLHAKGCLHAEIKHLLKKASRVSQQHKIKLKK